MWDRKFEVNRTLLDGGSIVGLVVNEAVACKLGLLLLPVERFVIDPPTGANRSAFTRQS